MKLQACSTTLIALVLITASADAQTPVRTTSPVKSITVTLRPGDLDGKGYSRAQVQVQYQFAICDGELHLAYSLDRSSLIVGPDYITAGGARRTESPVPKLSTIDFSGAVRNGSQLVGTFSDEVAGEALGFGCFTGQTQKLGVMKELIGPTATAQDVSMFIANLHLDVARSKTVVTSAAAETALASRPSSATAVSGVNAADKQPSESMSNDIGAATPTADGQDAAEPEELSSADDGLTYMVCVIWGRAYSPIYRIDGDLADIDAWAATKYSIRNHRAFLRTAYVIGAADNGLKGLKFNTKASCNVGPLDVIRGNQRAFRASLKENALLQPWINPDTPLPNVNFVRVN